MKNFTITIGLFLWLNAFSFAQLNSFFVSPNQVDAAYSSTEDSNYVSLNPGVTTNNKLLLFLPGTGAKPKHYKLFPNLAANLGYHSIALTYPNGYPTVASLCAGSSDTNCYYHIRQEVCYGTDVSADVTVDTFHCIATRLVKLLQYLNNHYPTQGWAQFLTNDMPAWEKIAVSGHSQGSGHALYLSKTQTCDRTIMFSGADDYSTYYSTAANWTHYLGSTPVSSIFSFLHLYDDVWDYANQYAVVQSVGMTSNGDDSTIVDGAIVPYGNSHCLYTSVNPLYPGIYSAKHNGPVVDFYTPVDTNGNALYTPVWQYMLSQTVSTALGDLQKSNSIPFIAYPNPFRESIDIKWSSKLYSIQMTDITGRIVFEAQNVLESTRIDVSQLSNGIFLLKVTDGKEAFCQKISKQ